jgi:tetratricopeptide (TPR) repeat protein
MYQTNYPADALIPAQKTAERVGLEEGVAKLKDLVREEASWTDGDHNPGNLLTKQRQSDMGIATAPAPILPPRQAEGIPPRAADCQPGRGRIFVEASQYTLKCLHKFASATWRSLPSYLAFYLLLLVTVFAAWQGRKPVMVIAPFQMPDKSGLPFSGDTIANVLQDRLAQIHDEIERQRNDNRLHAMDLHSLGKTGLQIPPQSAHFSRMEVPTRFVVEVKGLSYQGLIAVARAVMGTETTVSGDLVLNSKNGGSFILIARTAHGGPWQSGSHPQTAEGLELASRELAEKILESLDPPLAGVVFLNQGQVRRALVVLRETSERNPKNVAAKLALCAGMEAQQLYHDAVECYRSALSMKLSPPETLKIEERQALAGWLWRREGGPRTFEELAYKRHYTGALLSLGQVLDDTGEHARALRVYEEYLKARDGESKGDPRSTAIAHMSIATAYSKLEKHEEALTEFQKALDTIPGDAVVLVQRGMELADSGQLDAGIRELQSVVEENKNADVVPLALFRLGQLVEKRGEFKKASEYFRAAAERSPDYFEFHNSLATSLARQGRLHEALSEFREAAKLSSKRVDRKYFDVLANQWLGNALQAFCNYDGAASAYEEALRLKPDYRTARSELGHVFERRGQVARAIQEYRKALDTEPSELDLDEWLVMREGSQVSLGKALYEEGNYPEAGLRFGNAIDLNQANVEARYGLALALHKQGRGQEAALQCEALNDLRPDDAKYRACPRQLPQSKRINSACPPAHQAPQTGEMLLVRSVRATPDVGSGIR